MKITPKVFIERLEKLERQQEAQGKAIEWIKNEFLMGHDTEPLKPSQGKESLPTNTKEEVKRQIMEVLNDESFEGKILLSREYLANKLLALLVK